MAHFAKVENGLVTQVIVAEQDVIDSGLFGDGWIQTSYNTYGGQHRLGGTPLRKNYASIGSVYDSERDAFYSPQPYASWTLDEDTCLWKSPVEIPTDGKSYSWHEESLSWVEVLMPEVAVEVAPVEEVIVDLSTGSDTVTGSESPTV